MSSNAGIPLVGLLANNHTTTANAQYAQNNIPTPWPLLVFSVLVSFFICCVAGLTAMVSLDSVKVPIRKPKRQPGIPLQAPGSSAVAPTTPKKSSVSWIMWLLYYIAVMYCTFRAISAFMICVKSHGDDTTPLPAPSAILLALLATQIVHCDVGHHPITRFLLTLDILALAVAFGYCGYGTATAHHWLRYGEVFLAGGNCPLPAGDCLSQAKSWISVGCGEWKYEEPGSYWQFGVPYTNGGQVNSDNTLRATESAVVVFGTIWWGFVIAQLCDTTNILVDVFSLGRNTTRSTPTTPRQASIFSGLKWVLAPFNPRRLFASKRCEVRSDTQQSMYYVIIGVGIALAFLIMLMAIGGHTYQMESKQQTMYLDSFGPQVGTNLTFNSQGVLVGTAYLGNATSWSDCFEVRIPGSRNGFWSDWVAQNRKTGSLYRIAGGF